MPENYCPYCMNPTEETVCPLCSGDRTRYQSAPHHLQPGTVLDRKYVIGAVLGEGGFGITYIGRDLNLDVKIAIKEYFPSNMVSRVSSDCSEISVHVGDAQDYFENGKQQFLKEARTLAKFSGDPGIVSVKDFFSANNTAYIVMEYLEGVDLKAYLQSYGSLSYAQTVAMLTPIMRALSKIHNQGLIHRDISPANIMVLRDGSVKLLDFGAAREVGGPEEKSMSILLKPGYAPEEQYRSKGHQGPWTDVYALSATMYRMLTGKTPTDAMNRLFTDDLIPLRQLNPTVTPLQEEIVRKGMALQQADRYQTVDQLCDACIAGTIPVAADDELTVGATVDGSWVPMPQPPKADRTPPAPAPVQPVYPPVAHQKATPPAPGTEKKAVKKPRVFALIGLMLTGLLTMYTSLFAYIAIANEEGFFVPALFTLVFAGLTVLLGSLYFPRLKNKPRKPNVFCLVLCILSLFVPLFFMFSAHLSIMDGWGYESDASFSIYMTVLTLIPPVFFGYFFFPRLQRKLRNRLLKVGGSIGAAVLALLLVVILFRNLGTVTIGDQNIRRDAKEVHLRLDIVNNNVLAKLTQLKNMEELYITECFLDDADMEILGQLTQLKKLSITMNTDVTNVAPLATLTQLTSLDLTGTGVTDISCLETLTELETLEISNTNIKNLRVLEKFTKLSYLYMDSIKGLDPNTITMPSSITTLYCCDNGITSLAFLSEATELYGLDASQNKISDLTPLSGCQPDRLVLSANLIKDISPLDLSDCWTLDLSTNHISDISPLEGCKLMTLDLSYNQVTDLSPLAENTHINFLTLNNNQITDISPLKDCFHIQYLDISYNAVSDLSPLTTIDDLRGFTARGNKISDLTPLAACAKLIAGGSALDFRENAIVSLAGLEGYVNTANIYLSNNQINDVTPLKNCTALQFLKLNHNQVKDLSPLYDLPHLYLLEAVDNPLASLEGFRLNGNEHTYSGNCTFKLTYGESLDFEALSQVSQLVVYVYDVPPRQVDTIRSYKFFVQDAGDVLDPLPRNEDLPEEEETTEPTGATEVTTAPTEVTANG